MSEKKDHEYSMARSQLATVMSAARRLRSKMKGEGEIEAWGQSKITKAADYLDSAADYVDSGEMNEGKNGRCPEGQYYCYTNKECRPIPKGFMVDPEGMLRKENGASIDESKSGDSSLRDWFGKSRSSDGTPGWVQLGGKYAGKPCAKQPGQTTKPKCGSSKMKRDLSSDEEEKAFRRKNRQDPNPERKGKAINVATEETEISEGIRDSIKSAAKAVKKGIDQENKLQRASGETLDRMKRMTRHKQDKYGPSTLKQRLKTGADHNIDNEKKMKSVKEDSEFTILPLQIEIPNNIRDFNLGLMFRESLDRNSGMLFIFDESAEQSFYMKETRIPLDIAFINEEGIIESIKELEPFDETPVSSEGEVICALEVNRGWFAENNVEVGDEIDIEEAAGEKDACYRKVKSRYKVWPSAYASGALVKCRKVGAKNWGSKTQKEEIDLNEQGDYWHPDPKEDRKISGVGNKQRAREDKGESSSSSSSTSSKSDSKKLRPGESYMDYAKRQKASKVKPSAPKERKRDKIASKLGKLVDRIGGIKNEEVTVVCNHTKKGKKCPVHGIHQCPLDDLGEAVRMPAKTGNLIVTHINFRGRYFSLKMFFPQVSIPKKSDVQDQINKVYPGARLLTFTVTDYEPGEPILHAESAAWTRKEGQSKEGGLNEKGRKSYEKENPGSDLKAPSKKVGNKRRASFCARMKGMKKKLTSTKTANDPDSRINKSLRAWNC